MAVAAVDYVDGLAASVIVTLPAVAAGPLRDPRRRHRRLPPASSSSSAALLGARAAARPDADALRQPAARRGRRRARRARPRHQRRRASSPLTFAVGSGLAGLGGALGAEILGLDPTFPLKFMIYFLIVVTVGGTTSITGPFLASLLLGIADVAGKYYVPGARRLRHLHVMIVVLIWRPQGLFARARAMSGHDRRSRSTPSRQPPGRGAPAGGWPRSRSGSLALRRALPAARAGTCS